MCFEGFETTGKEPFVQRAKRRKERYEGRVLHMYLDTEGYVTCGIGHKISGIHDLSSINWIRSGEARSALEEYYALRRLPAGRLAMFYEPYCELRISNSQADQILENDIMDFLYYLAGKFPGFRDFPENARLAVLDMAFNLGVEGLVKKFPNCTAAIRRQDWRTAAAECHRKKISAERNNETRVLFESAI